MNSRGGHTRRWSFTVYYSSCSKGYKFCQLLMGLSLFILSRYKGTGIRIEDDILITNKGPVILTSQCPKEIDELQEIVGSTVK